MSAHAKYSPSSNDQLLACVGSNFMQYGLPDTAGADADEGTAMHEVAAVVLNGGMMPNLDDIVRTSKGKVLTFDEERIAYLKAYIDLVEERRDAYIIAGARVELRIEQRVNVSQSLGLADQFGTADVLLIAYWPDGSIDIELIDLKWGRGVKVDAQENAQLSTYALGALDEVDLLGPIKGVTLVIHQPRLQHVSEWRTNAEWIRAFGNTLAQVVARSEAIHARGCVVEGELNPGEKQCRFCRAKANCPALIKHVEETTLADFTTHRVPVAPNHNTVRLGVLMSQVDLVEGWCKAVRAETERRLLAGDPVEGWKLVEGRRGNRRWSDEQAAESVFKSMRLRHEQMYDYSLISPTTAEKLRKADVIGERQWQRVCDLITQPEGKPSVAPASDKRPAYSAVNDFEKV